MSSRTDPVPVRLAGAGLLLLDALATDAVTVRLQPAGTTDNEGTAEADPFALSAPYPNPAWGTARLTLTLAEASPVRVEAFDVLGRRVALVHDGPLAAGTHPLSLATASLSAGVYVVRAAAGAGAVAQRLVVR